MVKKANISDIKKKTCTGCGCCVSICPAQAISMVQDEEGFYYPQISEQRCISCQFCYDRCPVNIFDIYHKKNIAYASVNKSPERVFHSSSAGVFYEIAEQVITRQGVVCGAVFDKEYPVRHVLGHSLEDIRRMQGSKYVQSYCADVFPEIRTLLEDGSEVLFSGTPCQVAGLLSYLRKRYPNLYTIDLICHGTPSPGLFSRYLQLIGADEKLFRDIQFREKNPNERTTFRISIPQSGGRIYRCFAEKDPYYNLFLNSLAMRESCYQCKYAVPDRVSDITLGDCANAGNCLNSAPADAVKSTVVIHTENGQKLFEGISTQMLSELCSYEQEVQLNQQLHMPIQRPAERNNTLVNVKEITISLLRSHMITPNVKERFKRFIVRKTSAKMRKKMISIKKKVKQK